VSNLHKSTEGWKRTKARGQRVRGLPKERTTASKPISKQLDAPEVPASMRPKLRNRRRVSAPEGRFF
jgi:hypothetical protein